MVGTAGIRLTPTRRRPRFPLLKVVAVGCAVAIIAATALATDGFGLARYLKTGGSGGSPGPNPNPYGEQVESVTGSLVYLGAGGSGYVHDFAGYELCSPCPIAPPENTSYSPPIAGLWVFFNVTNAGANVTTFGNFTASTSGADPTLFALNFSICCYPRYDGTSNVYIGPGETDGFGVFFIATSIPNNNGLGYAIVLHATAYAN